MKQLIPPPGASRSIPSMLRACEAARAFLVFLIFILPAMLSFGLPAKLGDLDEDDVPTVLDVAKLTSHFNGTHPLSPQLALFADLNQDGVLNDLDQQELVREILGTRIPQDLPLTTIRETSPARGEADVAVTRETILHFAHPLSPFTSIDTTRFHADFGGRKILSCVQVATDRKKATLFYLEPLPSNARVIVTFDGNGLLDLIGRPMDANGDGQPGGVFTTEFETISTQPVPNTGITGTVYASERGTGGAEVPLAGVTITVDGAEETLRTTTAANGTFTLSPCPSGVFFVHIDGRTSPASSYPNGNYFPSVGKKWFAAPGRMNNPAGDLDDTPQGGGTGLIYLPCICAGTLNTVSPTQETVITFPPSVLAANPALAGTEIRVPANSLFADDGTRGGKVGLAPVAPDRLPSPLPPGLNPALVFTVQSDGATNFDRPVPVCLPNIPDPVTGKRLEPGAKSALFSFNHDTGEWEIAGAMTVSEDGNCVTTDVGVGIRQPGWHLSWPGLRALVNVIATATGPECGGKGIVTASKAAKLLSKLLRVSAPPAVGQMAYAGAAAAAGGGVIVASDGTAIPVAAEAAAAAGAAGAALAYAATEKSLQFLDPFRERLEEALDAIAEGVVAGKSLEEIKNDVQNELLNSQLDEAIKQAGDQALSSAKAWADAAKAMNEYRQSLQEYNECIAMELEGQPAAAARRTRGVSPNGPEGQIDYPAVLRRVAEIYDWPTPTSLQQISFSELGQHFMQESLPFESIELKNLSEAAREAGRVWAMLHATAPNAVWLNELKRSIGHLKLRILDIAGFRSELATELRLLIESSSLEGLRLNSYTFEKEPVYFLVKTDTLTQRGYAPNGVAALVLPADPGSEVFVYSPSKGMIGSTIFIGGNNGERITNTLLLEDPSEEDADADGLPDAVEEILGTSPAQSDSDADGISDLQEVLSNTGAGLATQTNSGSAAQSKVATSAADIAAGSRTLAVACGSAGTAFLATQGIAAPTVRTRVPTSSLAGAVGMGANAALIAESEAGFRCVVLDEQLNVTAATLLPVAGRASAAVASGGIGYGGTSSGSILELDLASGALLRQLETGAGDVEDLAVQGDWLFARKPDRLLAVSLSGTAMTVGGQLVLSTGRTPSANRLRIAVAEGRVFCTRGDGCQIVNTASLPALTLAGTVTGPGDDWRHFVPNGRVGVLAGKVQTTNSAILQVPSPASLFSIPAAGNAATFATLFDMPGQSRAIALERGIGYVVCDNGMLAVLNYLDFDRLRVPPSITLSSSLNLALPVLQAVESSPMRLTASVIDDVQVGNVEFYVDGVLAFDDGSYPFEHRFFVPRRSLTKPTFKVKARAVDTGGNATWSTEYEITMLPDTAPPTVLGMLPVNGSMNLTVTNAYVRFNELMDPATLLAPGLAVTEDGVDGTFDTTDDVAVSYFPVYRDGDRLARLAFSAPLPPGRYRLRAASPIADATGNAMATTAESVFRVFSLTDTDSDGIPDEWEPLLGTNPAVADSNGNGIADGLEDRDNDGTADGVEITRLGQDPRVADANGNGIADGQEDSDSDGLADGLEAAAGTSIYLSDTDGDGLDDNTEIAAGLNPLQSSLSPVVTSSSPPLSLLNARLEVAPVSANPVNTAGISFLNATREVTPVLPAPVQSAGTSFSNQP